MYLCLFSSLSLTLTLFLPHSLSFSPSSSLSSSLYLFFSLVLYINLFFSSIPPYSGTAAASKPAYSPVSFKKKNGEFVHVHLSISSPPSLFHSLFLSFPPSHHSHPLPLLVSLSSFLPPSLPLSPPPSRPLPLSRYLFFSLVLYINLFSLLSLPIVVQLLLASLHAVLSPSNKKW